ncbi:MAG: hypothetical protein AMXMBFR53_41520 [Gemmatimonadota bacterium]
MRDGAGSDFLAFQEAVLGRYSLDREIGRGGMGVVYLAHEVALDRPVALKVMPPVLGAEPALRERFLREARTAAKLSHPNIVPIHAVAEAGDYVYFAMAYIQGETLGARVRERGPLRGREAVRVLQEVAWALAYAHAEGVVHRDVKPDNILIEAGTGRALVTDFGIAQVRAERGPDESEAVVGTAEFMSPEQASGADVGPASDLYSLGVVGFHALAGKLPFEGKSVAEVLAKHLTVPAPPLASVAPEVPAHLCAAVDRCLRKDPADRFPDGGALAEALGAGTALQRELPIPLRLYVRSMRDLGAALPTILTLWVVIALIPYLSREAVSEWPFWVFVMMAGLTAAPVGILAAYARRLLSAGYTLDDGRLALREDMERRLEELRFEYGKGLTWVDKTLRFLGLGGVLTCSASVIVGLSAGIDVSALAVVSANVGIVSSFLAALRGKWRRDWVGEVARRIAEGSAGRLAFALGRLGLGRKALGAGAHRPTEMAISLAADRLFEELPREYRRELKGLPAAIQRLEADARTMRRQVEELERLLAEVGDETRGDGDPERAVLRAGLLRTRDEARARLTQAVSALEKIRLGLLRLHAGDGTVESLTLELGTAGELSRAIDALVQGQRDVARLLRPPELRTDP